MAKVGYDDSSESSKDSHTLSCYTWAQLLRLAAMSPFLRDIAHTFNMTRIGVVHMMLKLFRAAG